MGNLAKGSPLIKKLIFFVSYLTRAESHRAGTWRENPRRRNKGDRAEGVVEPLLQYPKTGER